MADQPETPEKRPEPPSADAAAEATESSALPVLAEDGLEKAIEGLSLEINKLLAAPKNMITFETVQQIAGVGQQVILLRTLLRDVSVDDLADDALPEDIADLFQNQGDIQGRGINQYQGGRRGGIARRVGARIGRARHQNPHRRGGAVVGNGNVAMGNQGGNHQNYEGHGYGEMHPMGGGAPFNAPQADFEDGDESAYAAARELRGLIKDLKDERATLMREHGDDHHELASLNARITKLKGRLDRLMGWLLDEPGPGSDAVPDPTVTPAPSPATTPTPDNTAQAEPEPERPPLSCTNCDQVQNRFWRDGDGDPLPCDICGSPMRDDPAPPEPLEAEGAVRQNDEDPPPPREQTA